MLSILQQLSENCNVNLLFNNLRRLIVLVPLSLVISHFVCIYFSVVAQPVSTEFKSVLPGLRIEPTISISPTNVLIHEVRTCSLKLNVFLYLFAAVTLDCIQHSFSILTAVDVLSFFFIKYTLLFYFFSPPPVSMERKNNV